MEFRAITESEIDPFFLALSNAFGEAHVDAEEVAADRGLIELDRTFAAFEDGRIVGCAGVFSQEMFVPGGAVVPTAGVTLVGVLPTHRRRGILRELSR
jgi:predicted acetyltransferase